jgi:type I restriction-modification system DNA methylase subunit
VITESGDRTMSSPPGAQKAVTVAALKPFLESFGYARSLLQPQFPLGDGQVVPLVAFAHPPADARTACIAVIDADLGTEQVVAEYRPLAAPVVFVCGRLGLEWWQQTRETPVRHGFPIPPDGLAGFFAAHHGEFAPDAIYRAKTWARFDTQYQRSFVDLGLMPLVEQTIGQELTTLISRDVQKLKSLLGWATLNEKQGQWLLKSVFWVVSAKILRDKDVGPFGKLDPLDVESLLDAVAEHFDAERIPIKSERQREALTEIAADVNGFSNLRLATTESLAHVYENALISKATRQALGTHSTPSYLVDYVVGRLTPWIAEIPHERRNVFEPACGHAAFLVSAMRLLSELLPKTKTSAQRHSYLRSRIHGCDKDDFALEIARLSLTLTDIPNPDGWDLVPGDMFEGDRLEQRARTATVLLANPPFENFGSESRRWYQEQGVKLRHLNKTTELLARVLPELPKGAVLGVVVPQGFLHSKNAESIRRLLTTDFELQEICVFPDKVFTFSDMESAVLIARKKTDQTGSSTVVRYRRVREREMEPFRLEFRVTSESMIESSLFQNESSDLRATDLRDVWDYCRKSTAAELKDVAEIGKGLEYKSHGIPRGMVTYSEREFPNAVRGFVRFERDLLIHELPREWWLSLDPRVLRRAPRHSTQTGLEQVLLNYSRVSRGPWRFKALLDSAGRPTTSNFLVVRSLKPHAIPPEFFWAVLNSPVANAYAFVSSSKRHNLPGLLGELPVPELSTTTVQHVVAVARNYLNYVGRDPDAVLHQPIDPQKARELLLRIDSEVLRMYALPRELEWQLLNLFAGWPRKGVPFKFDRYFPEHFTDHITLADYLAITADWPKTNHRRDALIRKKVDRSISAEERTELGSLQSLASLRVRLLAPLPLGELEQAHRLIVGDSPE